MPWWYVFVAWPEGITTWAIIGTGVAVFWQAYQTHKATTATQTVAESTRDQVRFMKAKERAQLRIEFDALNFVYDQKRDGYPIQFKVFLDGITRADIMRESLIGYLADSPIRRISWEPIGLGSVFHPDASPFQGTIFIQTADDDIPDNETDPHRIDLVRQRKLDVYVTGKILYRDLFGDEWELGIDKIWHQWSPYGVEGGSSGAWGAAGNGEGDYHRRAKPRPTRSEILASFGRKPQNPN